MTHTRNSMASEKYLGKAGTDPAIALTTCICCAKKQQKVGRDASWPDIIEAFVVHCHGPHIGLVSMEITCLQMQLVCQASET